MRKLAGNFEIWNENINRFNIIINYIKMDFTLEQNKSLGNVTNDGNEN